MENLICRFSNSNGTVNGLLLYWKLTRSLLKFDGRNEWNEWTEWTKWNESQRNGNGIIQVVIISVIISNSE